MQHDILGTGYTTNVQDEAGRVSGDPVQVSFVVSIKVDHIAEAVQLGDINLLERQ